MRFVFEAFKHLRPGIPVKCLHGRMRQEVRLAIYSQFCEERSVLIATDVAARGLDFNKAVDWVVQVTVFSPNINKMNLLMEKLLWTIFMVEEDSMTEKVNIESELVIGSFGTTFVPKDKLQNAPIATRTTPFN